MTRARERAAFAASTAAELKHAAVDKAANASAWWSGASGRAAEVVSAARHHAVEAWAALQQRSAELWGKMGMGNSPPTAPPEVSKKK